MPPPSGKGRLRPLPGRGPFRRRSNSARSTDPRPRRLYFGSTTGTQPATAPNASLWTEQPAAVLRAKALQAPILSAIPGSSPIGTHAAATATSDILLGQHVTDVLDVAQVIGGTATIVIRGVENNSAGDFYPQVHIRVVSTDGNIDRGVLYAGQTATSVSAVPGDPNFEYGIGTASSRYLTVPLSPVSALAGDRIIIETGARACTATTGFTVFNRYGDNAGYDLDISNGSTVAGNGWVEFSQRITFSGGGTPAYAKTRLFVVGDSLIDAMEPTLDLAFYATGWRQGEVLIDGLEGRFTAATTPSPGALIVVDNFRDSGYDAKTWIISLGTNDVLNAVASGHQASINNLLAKIDGQPGPHRIYWVNLAGDEVIGVTGTPTPSTGGDLASFNAKLVTTAAGRSDMFIIDYAAYCAANGNPASWWTSGSDPNHIHNSTFGGSIKRDFIAAAVAPEAPDRTAGIVGVGSLTVSGAGQTGTAALTGTGSLGASAGASTVAGAAALTATGTLGAVVAGPPTLVGSPVSIDGTGATTAAVGWDAGAVAGNLLLLWVAQAGGQAISSSSLGLTQPTGARVQNASNTAALTLLAKVLTSGDIAAGSTTVTFAVSQRHALTSLVVRGNGGGVDVVGATSFGSTSTTPAISAATPGQADELVVGAVGGIVSTTTLDVTFTWPGPLAQISLRMGVGALQRQFLAVGSVAAPGGPVASGPDSPVPSTAVSFGAFRVTVAPPAGPMSASLVGTGSLTAAGTVSSYDVDAIGVVGDSLTSAIETTLDDAIAADGWSLGKVSVDGLIGRFMQQSSPSPATNTAIDSTRAAIKDPRVWLMLLGTNDVLNGTQANWSTDFDAMIAKLETQNAGKHRTYAMTLVGDTTVNTGAPYVGGSPVPRTFADFNTMLAGKETASTVKILRDPVSGLDWAAHAVANLTAADWNDANNHVHMSTAGYAKRQAFIAAAIAVESPARTAGLIGAGTLTAGAVRVQPATVALAGVGQLTAAAVVTEVGAAALAAAGALAATGVATRPATAALAGAGSLAAAAVVVGLGAATLTAAGALTASGLVTELATAPLAAAGSLSATGTATGPSGAAAALTAVGALASTGVVTATGTAALTGTGALSAAAVPARPAAAVLLATGALGAAGTLTQPAAAALTGAGQLAAAGAVSAGGAVVLVGVGQLAGSAVLAVAGSVSLAGAGQLTATATSAGVVAAAASLAGAGALTASAVPVQSGAAALSGAGQMTAAAVAVRVAVAALTAAGQLAATGAAAAGGGAALAGAGTLAATGVRAAVAVAVLAGVGQLAAVGINPSAAVPGVLVGSAVPSSVQFTGGTSAGGILGGSTTITGGGFV